jgi:hypothetical protein
MVPPEKDPELFELFKKHGAEHNLETAAAVDAHFASHGFHCQKVAEPPLFEQLHVGVKIHVCPPSDAHPFLMLYTCGMSDRPQPVPSELPSQKFCELVMALPPDWPGFFDRVVQIVHGDKTLGSVGVPGAFDPSSKPPEFVWVMTLLFHYARYPHATGSFLAWGHLLTGNGEPFPGTPFTDLILLPPCRVPGGLKGQDGREIALLALVPLYPEETALKRARGTDELLRLFDAHGINELVDPNRPNVAHPPRRSER